LRAIALGAMVVATFATGGSTLSAGPARVVLVDRPFRCADYPQPLALDLVKVTLGPNYSGRVDDAANLNRGECTGRIRRLEVDTWIGDGVKIGAKAHDLVIDGGYVYCHDRTPLKHQDGVQALGGLRLSLRNLHVYCPSSNNASFFLTAGAGAPSQPTEGDWPTDVVCLNCQLDGGAQTVFIARSIRSGIKDSLVRDGRFRAVRVGEAIQPVVEGLVELPCAASCRKKLR
jgi:hypothetical protein